MITVTTTTATPTTNGPEPQRPVLHLAGDADDAELEPHICRSID